MQTKETSKTATAINIVYFYYRICNFFDLLNFGYNDPIHSTLPNPTKPNPNQVNSIKSNSNPTELDATKPKLT